MKIDVKPRIVEANDIQKLMLELRGIDCLYIVCLANGSEYTVTWTRKELDEFCQNKTVSEMLKSWEESIKRQHDLYVSSLETGLHPYHTKDIKIKLPNNSYSFAKPKFETVPINLTKETRKYFTQQVANLKEQFGELYLVKIV